MKISRLGSADSRKKKLGVDDIGDLAVYRVAQKMMRSIISREKTSMTAMLSWRSSMMLGVRL